MTSIDIVDRSWNECVRLQKCPLDGQNKIEKQHVTYEETWGVQLVLTHFINIIINLRQRPSFYKTNADRSRIVVVKVTTGKSESQEVNPG